MELSGEAFWTEQPLPDSFRSHSRCVLGGKPSLFLIKRPIHEVPFGWRTPSRHAAWLQCERGLRSAYCFGTNRAKRLSKPALDGRSVATGALRAVPLLSHPARRASQVVCDSSTRRPERLRREHHNHNSPGSIPCPRAPLGTASFRFHPNQVSPICIQSGARSCRLPRPPLQNQQCPLKAVGKLMLIARSQSAPLEG